MDIIRIHNRGLTMEDIDNQFKQSAIAGVACGTLFPAHNLYNQIKENGKDTFVNSLKKVDYKKVGKDAWIGLAGGALTYFTFKCFLDGFTKGFGLRRTPIDKNKPQ